MWGGSPLKGEIRVRGAKKLYEQGNGGISFGPFMYSEWYRGLVDREGLRLKKDGTYGFPYRQSLWGALPHLRIRPLRLPHQKRRHHRRKEEGVRKGLEAASFFNLPQGPLKSLLSFTAPKPPGFLHVSGHKLSGRNSQQSRPAI